MITFTSHTSPNPQLGILGNVCNMTEVTLSLRPAALGSVISPDIYASKAAVAINEHLQTVNDNLLSRLCPV